MPKEELGGRPLKVCLTGGGTAGHVTPHFALLKDMRERQWAVFYVGSKGIEKDLVRSQAIPFFEISTGKLRRYLSLQNGLDLFRIVLGIVQALMILKREKPQVVFSKGGFVAVPVAIAAWLLKIPVISHESDLTPGLATRIIAKFAARILYTFPDTAKYLPPSSQRVGTPIRVELLTGRRDLGLALCGFDPTETIPTILVMGGSQGAQRVNEALKAILPWLVTKARVVHLTGQGKQIDFHHPRYKAFEFVSTELSDLYALSDYVVSRAGANSIFEVLAVGRPMLLIPLEIASRGDQVLNARSFEKAGWALILRETQLNPSSFQEAITQLLDQGPAMRENQQKTGRGADPHSAILDILAKSGNCREDQAAQV